MNTRTTLPRIYLIRHGETAWSLTGQHTGRADIALTARGEAQARTLGDELRDVVFDRVLTSPLLRTRQTCEAIGWHAAGVDPDLMEWDYGDYEGLRSAEIHAARPDWNLFQHGCPNGETPADISSRADRMVARLRAMDGRIAVCSHGHFGRVLGARWIGLSVAEAQGLQLDTASVSVLGYEHGRADQPAIALWNAVSADAARAPSFT